MKSLGKRIVEAAIGTVEGALTGSLIGSLFILNCNAMLSNTPTINVGGHCTTTADRLTTAQYVAWTFALAGALKGAFLPELTNAIQTIGSTADNISRRIAEHSSTLPINDRTKNIAKNIKAGTFATLALAGINSLTYADPIEYYYTLLPYALGAAVLKGALENLPAPALPVEQQPRYTFWGAINNAKAAVGNAVNHITDYVAEYTAIQPPSF